ncbi:hypothetical protein ACFWB8_36825, partial [Streptomyces sp. NPDC060031]
MQLRRAVPLSLVALLASAGCVSVGPQTPAVPARRSVPQAGATEVPAPRDGPAPLPLGKLPATPADAEPDPDAPATRAPRPPAARHAKP